MNINPEQPSEYIPHRRKNLLTGEWVQVSPHRSKRPWQGKQEKTQIEKKPSYDPDCYLCPGNKRAGGNQNPEYKGTYVFDNDFSALLPETDEFTIKEKDLLISHSEKGICRVICFSPEHCLTLPEMSREKIEEVVQVWVDQYIDLGKNPDINYVQIFENKGEIMGCSNPHPHGQIWAQQTIPDAPGKEWTTQKSWFSEKGKTLLSDYLELELEKNERVVTENGHFVVLVPYWAFWPFETIIISRRPFGGFDQMTRPEKRGLADIIKKITTRYDNLFKVSFPYSAGFHPAPTDGYPHPEWHFHMHFYPPLLRSATVKKFRVGYEMLGNPQRDITPEKSTSLLRSLPEVYFNQT